MCGFDRQTAPNGTSYIYSAGAFIELSSRLNHVDRIGSAPFYDLINSHRGRASYDSVIAYKYLYRSSRRARSSLRTAAATELSHSSDSRSFVHSCTRRQDTKYDIYIIRFIIASQILIDLFIPLIFLWPSSRNPFRVDLSVTPAIAVAVVADAAASSKRQKIISRTDCVKSWPIGN